MKRLVFFICTLLCANVLLAQTIFLVGDLGYEVTSTNPAEVMVYSYQNNPTTVFIPETVSYEGTNYSVTSIGDYAFGLCSSLTSVTIPNSVTSIGGGVFYNCSSLTSVTLSNNITELPSFCDYSCGYYSYYGFFENCSSLTSITIPNSVTSIGDYAFRNCSSLTNLNYNAINCNDFDSYSHPFENCPISTINIGDSVQIIPNYFAYNLDSLTSVTILNSVTSIGDYAFASCSSLTSITIPNSVTSIGNKAFYGCSSLTSVTLPQNATISNSAFENTGSTISIDNIIYKSDYIPLTIVGNYTFNNTGIFLTFYLNGISYNNHEGNENLMVWWFEENISNNVIIPSTINFNENVYSITSIGDYAFGLCSSLTSITIPNSITSIGEEAFYNCNNLTSVICLGNNPPLLDNNAFLATPLNKVLLFPFCSIENYANSNWNNYFDINIKEDGLTYVYNQDNTLKVINCVDTITSVVIPSNIYNETCSYNVTEIGNSAFYNCSNLTSITIGNNITSIKDSAFYGCSSLTTLNFNAINCNDFNSNNHPFVNSPISTITIGENVQRIPNYFAYNNSLITSINVPNSVSEIGTNAFNGCSNVLSISLGNSVTSLGDSAFYGCSNITSIDIPNSVTEIGADAFNGCDMMMLVNLGENLSFIGSNAFNGCAFLQSVNCLATNPPTLQGSSVFPNPNIATLTVPCGSLEAYSSPISFWNILFNGRISENGYNVVATANDNAFGSVAVEGDCSTATLTATANEGYVFLSWNDGNTENPRVVSLTSDTAFTAIFALIDNSSLSEDAEFADLSVYPNPTRGKVSFSQAIEKVEVIDLSGKTLQTYENANEINIEALPAGVYHLRMTIGDKTTTRKVIKE